MWYGRLAYGVQSTYSTLVIYYFRLKKQHEKHKTSENLWYSMDRCFCNGIPDFGVVNSLRGWGKASHDQTCLMARSNTFTWKIAQALSSAKQSLTRHDVQCDCSWCSRVIASFTMSHVSASRIASKDQWSFFLNQIQHVCEILIM